MTVCSTTALRKYLTQHSNLGQPSREKAVSTTRAHAEGETIINSGRYRRPLFKSSLALVRAVMSIPGIAKQNRERRLSTQRARLCSPQKQTLVLTSGHILSSVIRSPRGGRFHTSALQAQPFQA